MRRDCIVRVVDIIFISPMRTWKASTLSVSRESLIGLYTARVNADELTELRCMA